MSSKKLSFLTQAAFLRFVRAARASRLKDLDLSIVERRWRPNSVFWTLLPCAAVVCLSVIAGVQLAEVQGKDNARARSEEIADGILLVMEDLSRQIDMAVSAVNAGSTPALAPTCDNAYELKLYRAAASLQYIEAIGLVGSTGATLTCSTFGPLGAEIQFGQTDFTSPSGYSFYKHATSPSLLNSDYTLIIKGKAAVFVNNTMAKGILSHMKEVSLGAYRKDGGPLIFGRDNVDPWSAGKVLSGRSSYFEENHLVAYSNSDTTDYLAFVAFSSARVDRAVVRAMKLILPIAVMFGFLTAGVLFLALRKSTSLASSLGRALPTKNVYMNYQPMVNMMTREYVGAEALMRWKNNGEMISPDKFIAVAEKAGMMGLVTRRVTSLVAWDTASYLRNHPGFHVSINLSAPDLISEQTFGLLRGFLELTGISPVSLWVEITETGVLDANAGAQSVQRLKEMGVRVAVDDFGTGYSSLSMLSCLNVDILKIDKKFTQTIKTGIDGEEGSEIILAIIGLANSLKLDMVAEGVKREEQAQLMLAHGVKFGQGWLFGKPTEMKRLEENCAH